MEISFKNGDTVILASVHPNMNATLKKHLNDRANIVVDEPDYSGKLLVQFEEQHDINFGRWWVHPRHLRSVK